MSRIDELNQELFEEIFRDKLRRALEGDAPAFQELQSLAQQINDVLDSKNYYDGNKEHAVGTIYLRDGITKIENNAFRDCKRLEKIILPESLKEIGSGAFAGCSGLTEIQFPYSLTKIGIWVLSGCYNLRKITYYKKTEPLIKNYFGSRWNNLQKTVLD